MIPGIYITLEKFPLTRTGKTDRKSLPNPVVTDIKKQAYVAPQNDVEAKIVEIWSIVLQQEKDSIGVLDNFFELGGNSLHAVVVVNKINKTFNTVFSIQDLYESLIIKELAELVHFFIVQQEDNIEEYSDEIIL